MVATPVTKLGRAALTGAAVVLGTFIVKDGLPLEAVLDPFVWIVLGVVALFGAILGAGGELAWRHLKESRRWLLWTALCLTALSGLIVLPFVQEARANTAFLATADSTRAVVEMKIQRGGPRLSIPYTVAGQPHRLVTPGNDMRYDQWTRGDSVWVYYRASAPDSARIGRFGPNPKPVLQSLGWLWSVGGVLTLGYMPLVVKRLQWRKAAATRGSAQFAGTE